MRWLLFILVCLLPLLAEYKDGKQQSIDSKNDSRAVVGIRSGVGVSGSGVSIAKGRLVLTAAHLVAGGSEGLQVFREPGSEPLSVVFVAIHPTEDIAVLGIEKPLDSSSEFGEAQPTAFEAWGFSLARKVRLSGQLGVTDSSLLFVLDRDIAGCSGGGVFQRQRLVGIIFSQSLSVDSEGNESRKGYAVTLRKEMREWIEGIQAAQENR